MSLNLGEIFRTTTTNTSGTLTVADINGLFQAMYDHAYVQPDVMYISPRQKKRIVHWMRVGKVYRAHPLPDYKIRKCHMRRIYAQRHKGMARIARIERKEAQDEAEYMRHICEDSPQEWEAFVTEHGLHDVRTVVMPPMPMDATETPVSIK